MKVRNSWGRGKSYNKDISIKADLLIGLRQFKNYVRWKELWVKNRDVFMEGSISEEE